MSDMSIQDRYDEISELSGLSEEIIRRVFKATRASLAASLERGERATLPGICTFTPEMRHRIDTSTQSMVHFAKIKAKPSSSLESELAKLEAFNPNKKVMSEDIVDSIMNSNELEESIKRLNILTPEMQKSEEYGIRTKQINALL